MSPRVPLRLALPLFGALFILTGCAGLLAEQCFEKLLTRLVGASTPAAAIVLAVYFLGLTLGNALYGRRLAGRGSPLKIYALLEWGVGLWALALIALAGPLVPALVPLLRPGLDHFWLLQSLRFLIACLWILPPTILMGASFPAVVDALARLRVPQPRRAVSRFYALNLLGAIAGALIGPFLTFPRWGLYGTLGFTAAADGIAGLGALWLASRLRLRTAERKIGVENYSVEPGQKLPAGLSLLALTAGASGFLFFGLEVVWTHLLGAAIGNSVYAFAGMLACVLAGLGLGGALITRLLPEDRPRSPAFIAGLLALSAAALALQFLRWPVAPGEFMRLGGKIESFAGGEFLRWSETVLLLLPPATALGMIFPALFRLENFPLAARARAVALLGGCNAVGCVLGALLTGFVLIPQWGSELTLRLLAFALIALGFALAIAHARGGARLALGGALVALAILWAGLPHWNLLHLTNGGPVYFRSAFVSADSTLRFFHEDTRGGLTTVVGNAGSPVAESPTPDFYRTLLTNGKFQANDSGEVDAQTGLALVPILHAPRFDDALVIGLGSGHTASIVHEMGFKQIDIAEIAPGIVAAAGREFPHINGRILEQPNVSLHLEDGRNWLLLSEKKYDMITMEISSVWFAGSTSLYSREFYALARARLKPGGILQQWIQIHHIGEREIGSVIATLREVFPRVSFWVVGGQGILIAGDGPQQLQPEALAAYFKNNPWRAADRDAMRDRLGELAAGRLLAPDEVDALLAAEAFPRNSDSNRFLEYATPRYNLSRAPHEQMNLRALGRYAKFPPLQTAGPVSAELRDLLAGVTPALQRKKFELDTAGR